MHQQSYLNVIPPNSSQTNTSLHVLCINKCI